MFKKLTTEEKQIIIHKGTEKPFSGKYDNFYESGTYRCKQCDSALYNSEDKFKSGCGWPSFDDEIPGAVKQVPDADGRRTEILCANCDGHLGHVFVGEHMTDKNTRHCVNSISLVFTTTQKAYFAGGCFWGVEHLFQKQVGVESVVSGYMGGAVENPTYEQVCTGQSGHLEVVEVTYDTSQITFEALARLHFEIHDPTQANGQGPDIGPQYLSAIFYTDESEKQVSEKLIGILREKGLDIATELIVVDKFWPAEDYHQDYYQRKGTEPYCHIHTKRFDD
ncbi:MAG: bifunctional methionine sulfoxide reductase B/A protein [bacterium]|nr:bifunctional methionine sulfoxide reductase B/A protein [bacterium]